MTDRKQYDHKEQNARTDDLTKRGGGKQGVDMDPDQQASNTTDNTVYETQKGKNKVDGDPSKPSDQPANEDI